MVAGIQEMRWVGKDAWTVNGYTLLHSGCPLPDEGEPQVRNEGVGILLDEHATATWRDAGERWEAVSSRVVMARPKVVRSGQRRHRGKQHLHVSGICVCPNSQGSSWSQGQVH